LIFTLITVINLPHLLEEVKVKRGYRSSFLKLEHDWVEDLSGVVKEGETVVFLPWGNDFLINYIAACSKVVAYNIGGDKNLAEARRHWPEGMQGFLERSTDPEFSDRVIHLLMDGEADRVILPYVNMGGAAYQWPCPLSLKEGVMSILDELSRSDNLKIVERKYYASIELTSGSRS